MNEIVLVAIALIVGIAVGLALRKKPVEVVTDHSKCDENLGKLQSECQKDFERIKQSHLNDINWLNDKFATEKAEYQKSALLLSPEVQAIADSALPLSSACNSIDMSGEAKRHQVYSRLIKNFPDASRQDIALAIEIAVRSLNVA